jgi:hypothetical protein
MDWYEPEHVDDAIAWLARELPATANGTIAHADLLAGIGLPAPGTIGVGQLARFMATFTGPRTSPGTAWW